jgi:hypothetical protein
VDPRADLGDLENRKFVTLPGLELRPLGRPARIQSLYRQHYPGYKEIGIHVGVWCRNFLKIGYIEENVYGLIILN